MPNTIADNLLRLQVARTGIANAITTMGGTVTSGDGFEDFPADIATIPSGTEIANTIMLTGGGTFNKMLSGENATSQDKNSATIVVLPSNIIDIPQGCLSSCTSLKAVAIPNGVETIGSYAFAGTGALKTIAIPNSVTSIDVGAFAASGIETISLSHNMAAIQSNLFGGCTNLRTITIPSSVTSIAPNAFSGCTSLTKIIIDKTNGSISGAPWGATNATVVWTG